MGEDLTRRDFVGAMGAMGAVGAMGMMFAPGMALASEGSASASASVSASGSATSAGGPSWTAAESASGSAVDAGFTYDWRINNLSIADVEVAAANVPDYIAQEILDNEPEVTADHVQDDGTVIPAVYLALRNRINRNGLGVGVEVKDGNWDFLMQNFSEEEAAYYLKFPMYKFFNAEMAGAACGISEADALDLCESLASRGLLNRVRRSGVAFFHTLAFAHGIFEFNMNHFDDEGWLGTMFGLAASDYGYQSRNLGSTMYYTIPCSKEIVGDEAILPYNDWEAIINRNQTIAVSPCQCRHAQKNMNGGVEICDHPYETCISTGEQAEYYIENGIGRQIDQDEAKQILNTSVEAGMVMHVMCTKQADVICSCHGDCCLILKGYLALDGDVANLKCESMYELQYDKDKCIQCGACVEQCTMFTISMDDEGYPSVGNYCIRCGQCCRVCPAEARKLVAVPEEDRFYLPDDMIDDYHHKALRRAKLGMIKDFLGDVEDAQ